MAFSLMLASNDVLSLIPSELDICMVNSRLIVRVQSVILVQRQTSFSRNRQSVIAESAGTGWNHAATALRSSRLRTNVPIVAAMEPLERLEQMFEVRPSARLGG
jgi:hypothetical protein